MIRALFSSLLKSTIGAAVGGAKAVITTFITVNGNDMTIFGVPLTLGLVQSAAATNPTLIMGSNGTAPTKSAATPTGLALTASATPGAARKVINLGISANGGSAFLDHFLNVANLEGGLVATVTGGTVTDAVVDGRSGVMRLASSASATANRRAAIACDLGAVSLGFGRAIFYAPLKFEGTLLDGVTTTGRISVGFIDSVVAAQSTDGVFFRHTGGNWFAVSRASNIETAVDTGIAASLSTWRDFWIDINAAGTQALYYIDGALVATVVDNIPMTTGQNTGYGFAVSRVSANAVNVQLDADFLYIRLDHPALMPFGF